MQTVVSSRSNHPNRINIGTSIRNGNDKGRQHVHGPARKIIQASSSFLVGTDCWHDSFASLKQSSANKDFGDWSSVDFEDDCFSFDDNSNNKNEKPTNNKSSSLVPNSTSTTTTTTAIEERRKKGKHNDSQLLRRASSNSSRRKKETKKGSSSKTKSNSEDTDISAAVVVPPLPPADIRNRRSRFQQAGQQHPPHISTRSLKSIARRNSIPNKKESDSSSLDKRASKDTTTRRKAISSSSSSSHRQKEEDESSSFEEENRKEKSTHRHHRSSHSSRRGSSLVKNATVVELSPKRSFSAGSNEHNDTIDELHRLLHRRRRKPKGINSEESSKRTGKQIADVVKAPPLTKSNAEEVKSDHARPPSTVAYEEETPTLPTRSQSMGSSSARHHHHHHHDAVPRRSGRKGSSHRGSTDNGPRDRDPIRADPNEHKERRRISRRRNGTTAAKKNSDHVETEMRDFLEHMSW